MRKNILFLGGAGFIGSNLIRRFLNDDRYAIFVLELEGASLRRVEPFADQITIYRGDAKDTSFVSEILAKNEINTVVHLASTLLPSSTIEDYQVEMTDLILPGIRLMKVCSERKIKLIYFSSGGTIYGSPLNAYHKEDDKPEPISYYGLSKLIMEEAILFENRTSGLEYLILRPSNPYGPGQDLYGKQGLIAVSIGKIVNNETITIWGDGNNVRDYIHIDDLSDAVYRLEKQHTSNQVLNIGTGIGYSINDIIELIRENCNREVIVNYNPKRSVDVSSIILDVTKLKSIIDFDPIPINLGIKHFLDEVWKEI